MVRGSRLSLALALAVGLVAAKASAEGKALKSHEHVTERAGVKIALYEKWAPGEEAKWRQNGKVVLLVHGATWSGRCTFDPAPGYSMMDAFAEAGYDVFAIDLHGYGKSGKTDRDNTGAASAALDLDAAVDYIRAYRWVEKVHVFGYQWGAQSAALFASTKPNKVGKLILFGMRFNLVERKALPEGPFRLNGMSNAMMKPDDGDLDPEFVRKRASVCLAADPQSPNGALADLTRASPVDPTKIRNSTLSSWATRRSRTRRPSRIASTSTRASPAAAAGSPSSPASASTRRWRSTTPASRRRSSNSSTSPIRRLEAPSAPLSALVPSPRQQLPAQAFPDRVVGRLILRRRAQRQPCGGPCHRPHRVRAQPIHRRLAAA